MICFSDEAACWISTKLSYIMNHHRLLAEACPIADHSSVPVFQITRSYLSSPSTLDLDTTPLPDISRFFNCTNHPSYMRDDNFFENTSSSSSSSSSRVRDSPSYSTSSRNDTKRDKVENELEVDIKAKSEMYGINYDKEDFTFVTWMNSHGQANVHKAEHIKMIVWMLEAFKNDGEFATLSFNFKREFAKYESKPIWVIRRDLLIRQGIYVPC
jgi:hypothetical protein